MWGADDAVVVFATDITLKLDGGVVEAFSHPFNEKWRVGFREVQKRIEVEVSVAAVSVNGRLHIKFFKE